MAVAIIAQNGHNVGTSGSYSAANAGGVGATAVFVFVCSVNAITTITYGGISLSEIVKAENNPDIFMWAAHGIPDGNQTFAITYTASPADGKAWCVTTSGATATALQTNTQTGTSAAAHPTATITAQNGGIAFDCMMTAQNVTPPAFTQDAGQTEMWDEKPHAGDDGWGASYEATTGTTVAMGILTAAGADRWGYIAASFPPVVAGGSPMWLF